MPTGSERLCSGTAAVARRLALSGRVQGVGFRPFVYRLAQRHALQGWVQNRLGEVHILVQGPAAAIERFRRALLQSSPPIARPELRGDTAAPLTSLEGFLIRKSRADSDARIFVPPDYFACGDCLREMNDPRDRRYRYPFINCTQCGPRYTLIERLPYDRESTSMARFELCPECRTEYEDPLERRFHAEPLACAECGPSLRMSIGGVERAGDNDGLIGAAASALAAGKIVAVKGIGGYHLLCEAGSESAVARLRARKRRPHKPLAVMFPQAGPDGLAVVRRAVELTAAEAELLQGPMRPIVLARRRPHSGLAPDIAPGLAEVGVFLPYSPLHHRLLSVTGTPLVATSGNLSGEPVLTHEQEAQQRLAAVADVFLHHDRPIVRPADDPVCRSIGGRPVPLRLGRGNAPLELELPWALPAPVLAVGGHMKNTLALGWGDRCVISPHIGDMASPRSLAVFEQVAADLQHLYGAHAEALACDAHPGYTTTRWALAQGIPVTRILHHHAHASALTGEHNGTQRWLVFTWDGVGLGDDGSLWGGETLLGHAGGWRRVARMRPFHLPGGDRAGREPWRSAAALCWETGSHWDMAPDACTPLVRQAWARRLNCPRSTAVGRLFDAAAALALGAFETSYEGQGPMLLEAAAQGARGTAVELPLHERGDGLLETDWEPLLAPLRDEHTPVPERAAAFHASLARALLRQAQRLRAQHRIDRIGLCGGVFQNRILTEQALSELRAVGFEVRLAERVPCNDAGLSFGQIIEYAARVGGSHGS